MVKCIHNDYLSQKIPWYNLIERKDKIKDMSRDNWTEYRTISYSSWSAFRWLKKTVCRFMLCKTYAEEIVIPKFLSAIPLFIWGATQTSG